MKILRDLGINPDLTQEEIEYHLKLVNARNLLSIKKCVVFTMQASIVAAIIIILQFL